MAIAAWPEGFAADSKEEFTKAVDGWRLTLKLWELKIKWTENIDGLSQSQAEKVRVFYCPIEPDVHDYSDFVAYAGDKLVIMKNGDVESSPELSGKKFLPQDENISVLLTVAGAHFTTGASLVMAQLPRG